MSIVANFLELFEILSQEPVEKPEHISHIFIEIYNLLNQYRPHQAKHTLRNILKFEVNYSASNLIFIFYLYGKETDKCYVLPVISITKNNLNSKNDDELIDHGEISYDDLPNQLELKNIQLAASCCMLIASYILNNEELMQKNNLLKLVYGNFMFLILICEK